MSGALLLVQAAVDSLPAYREFPAIGSRAAGWDTAAARLRWAVDVGTMRLRHGFRSKNMILRTRHGCRRHCAMPDVAMH